MTVMTPAQELSKLAAEVDSIFIRNTLPGVAVYSNRGLDIEVVLQAKDDPGGQDIMEISAAVLKDPNFRSNLLRGIYVIEDAPEEINAAVDRLKSNWSTDTARRGSAAETLVKHADKVVARARTCIVPKGRDLCGQIASGGEDTPPLCTEHQQLAGAYVQETGATGATVWRRR